MRAELEQLPLHWLVVPAGVRGRPILGSLVGGAPEAQETLDFRGAHAVGCEIEETAPADINDASERIVQGGVKHRSVIDGQQTRQKPEPVPVAV